MADSLTDDLRRHAQAMAMLVERGFVDPREVTDWACELVARQEHPSDELLELAGAIRPHPVDVARLLRALPGTPAPEQVLARFAAGLARLLRADPSRLESVVTECVMMSNSDALPPHFSDECCTADYQLALVGEGGELSHDEVHAQFLAFLDRESAKAR